MRRRRVESICVGGGVRCRGYASFCKWIVCAQVDQALSQGRCSHRKARSKDSTQSFNPPTRNIRSCFGHPWLWRDKDLVKYLHCGPLSGDLWRAATLTAFLMLASWYA